MDGKIKIRSQDGTETDTGIEWAGDFSALKFDGRALFMRSTEGHEFSVIVPNGPRDSIDFGSGINVLRIPADDEWHGIRMQLFRPDEN